MSSRHAPVDLEARSRRPEVVCRERIRHPGRGWQRRPGAPLRRRPASHRRAPGLHGNGGWGARRRAGEPPDRGLRAGERSRGPTRAGGAATVVRHAGTRGCHRRSADGRRLHLGRDRHGDAGGRRPRVCVRTSALQPGSDGVPDDSGRRHRRAAESGQFEQARQPGCRGRHHLAGSSHRDCRAPRAAARRWCPSR